MTAAVSLAAFLSWLDSDAYLRHVDACARWAADDPRLIVGHVGSYG
jgi:hypothetical protein